MKHLSETRKDGDALGTFYGVGLGPGDPELITWKALKILQKADRIYTAVSRQSERSVSGAVIAALPEICAPAEELRFSMSGDWTERRNCIDAHAGRTAEELKKGLDRGVVTIGDPMTYSTCLIFCTPETAASGLRERDGSRREPPGARLRRRFDSADRDTEICDCFRNTTGDSSLNFGNSTLFSLKIHAPGMSVGELLRGCGGLLRREDRTAG